MGAAMTDWPNPITNPGFYDPFASADRHPILPCGLNSVAMNGDEANGAGFNEAIWPFIFDSYVGFAPIVLTEERLAVFDECPDITFACWDDVEVIRMIDRTTELRGRWPVNEIAAQPNTMVFQPDFDTKKVAKESNLVQVPDEVGGVRLVAQKEMEVTE